MFSQEAIEELKKNNVPVVIQVDERDVLLVPGEDGGYEVEKDPHPDTPRATSLRIATLSGLVEYLTSNVDELEPDGHMLRVESPTKTSVVSKISPVEEKRTREQLVHVEIETSNFPFGQQLDQEQFVLQCMLKLVDNEDRKRLLALVGNVRSNSVTAGQDDGVSQVVESKKGVVLNAEVKIGNPFLLAPYRTFREVEQPASMFILRAHAQGDRLPFFSLHEADGSTWALEAIKRTAAWLVEKKVPLPVIA